MSVFTDLIADLNLHPIAIAIGILICAIAARIIGRVVLYGFMIVLIVVVGVVWTEEFMEWIG